MRRLLSFLLPVALASFAVAPACAQRGGHAGGRMGGGTFSARGGIGFHGQPQAHPGLAPRSFFRGPDQGIAPGSRIEPGVGIGHIGQGRAIMRSFNQRTGPEMQNRWRGNRDRDRFRGGRSRRLPYGFAYNTYLVPNTVGYPFGLCDPFFDTLDFCNLPYGDDYDLNGYGSYNDDNSYDSYDGYQARSPRGPENPEPEMAGEGNYAYPPAPATAPEAAVGEPSGSVFRPEYRAPASEEAHPQPATTLVFKDHRPPEQVHNYVLTATTLYGLDQGASKEIPISEIDIPATVETNRAGGVEFNPPVSISSLP